MKLGDILRSAGTSRPTIPRPVEFMAKGTNDAFQIVKAKVAATFIFVDEDARQSAIVDARESVAKRFPGKDVPKGLLEDETAYHVLFEALREAQPNKDGIYERLCTNMLELRTSLVREEAQRLFAAYADYCAEEFPPSINGEEWATLIDEAKKSSLPDLLSRYGYEKALSTLSFMAGRSVR